MANTVTIRESRVKKSILNAKVNLTFYFIILLLSFFSRRVFLENLGAEFIGFTGTLQNLLGFLNLAELGIAGAIGYVLYQPLYDKNESKIIQIISVFGYLYRKIGIIILVGGLLLSLFLPLIFRNIGINIGIIYFAFFSYLASSLIGYFANYKQTLLAADQRNYIVTAYFQGASIVRIGIQMIVAYKTGSYFWWIFIELVFGFVHSVILNWKINKVYPWLKSDIKSGKSMLKQYPEIIKYTKQLFIHKIAGFVQFQTNPFIIYAYTSLSLVAAYGNYMMIINNLLNFVNKFLGSTEAAIGNMVASRDAKKIFLVFRELTAVRYFIAGIEVFGLYVFSSSFISLWVGKEFVLSNITVDLMIGYIFLMQTRGTNDQFIYAYGLFGDVWAAIIEMIVSLGCSVGLGYLYGLPGVISGGVIGMLIIVYGWKPYYLFRKGFNCSILTYWQTIIKLLLIIIISILVGKWFDNNFFESASSDFLILGIRVFSVTIFYTILSFSLFLIFDKGMKKFVLRMWKQVLKK